MAASMLWIDERGLARAVPAEYFTVARQAQNREPVWEIHKSRFVAGIQGVSHAKWLKGKETAPS